MIEKYAELKKVYDKHKHLYSHEYDNDYEEALNELLETLGMMVNECEEIFSCMAESYCVIKDNEEELRRLFCYEECI